MLDQCLFKFNIGMVLARQFEHHRLLACGIKAVVQIFARQPIKRSTEPPVLFEQGIGQSKMCVTVLIHSVHDGEG